MNECFCAPYEEDRGQYKISRDQYVFRTLLKRARTVFLALLVVCSSLYAKEEQNLSKPLSVSELIVKDTRNCETLLVQKKLFLLENINSVALVGSSGAGKTTLLQVLKEKFPEVTFPKRYITRRKRDNEVEGENIHVDKETFRRLVGSGDIGLHWVRHMENGREEFYGFEGTNPESFVVYSANNDFFRNVSPSLLKNTLILGVYAPDKVRGERLHGRSPEMSKEERGYRSKDLSENIFDASHIVVENFGTKEKAAKKEISVLLQAALEHYLPWGEIRDLEDYSTLFSSRLFSVKEHSVLFSDGEKKRFQFVERSPGVRVLVTSGNYLLLNCEYRLEIGDWDYRLPGGKVFESRQEFDQFLEMKGGNSAFFDKVTQAALKELNEETGLEYLPGDLVFMEKSPCGSVINWDLYFFHVPLNSSPTFLSERIETVEGERLKHVWVSWKEALNLCLTKAIREDRTRAFLFNFILINSNQEV